MVRCGDIRWVDAVSHVCFKVFVAELGSIIDKLDAQCQAGRKSSTAVGSTPSAVASVAMRTGLASATVSASHCLPPRRRR